MVRIQDVHVSFGTMWLIGNPKLNLRILVSGSNPSKNIGVQRDVVSYSCELHDCEFGEVGYIVIDSIEQCHVLIFLKKINSPTNFPPIVSRRL